MENRFRVFQVEKTQKWFPLSIFWGRSGTEPLAEGHTGWLFSQEALGGIEPPTKDA